MHLLLLALIPALFLFSASAAISERTSASFEEPTSEKNPALMMPHVWMRARQALIEAHRQVGLSYAVVPAQFENPVGPFPIEQPIRLDDLVVCIATATQTDAHWVAEVVVFDPRTEESTLRSVSGSPGWSGVGPRKRWVYSTTAPGSGSVPSERECLDSLAGLGHSASVPGLVRLAGSKDASTRLYALAAMQRLEGDFIRNIWPGRKSIYEVLAGSFNRDSLLFALEEGGPVGGRIWKLAAEILGRAREPLLTRGVWWNLWEDRPGTVPLTLWCMGRCGDPSGSGPLGERLWDLATNDVSDLYLGAVALGQVDAVTLLAGHRDTPDPTIRRAVAMGLGACRSREAAAAALEPLLRDSDPAVQFIACQSLGRLGATKRLLQLISEDSPIEIRTAALEALSETNRVSEALKTVGLRAGTSGMASDSSVPHDPVFLAKLAEVYGRSGGIPAGRALPALLGHSDRWVRSAAAEGLAKLGTLEAIERVGALTADPDEEADVRIAAVIGLGRSLSPHAAAPLAAIAGNSAEHYRLRQYAVLALSRLAERAGHARMLELIDPNSARFLPFALRHVRLEAREKTAAALIPFLTYGDRDSACAAAGNLSELGCRRGTRELLEGSDIFDNHTRMTHNWGAIRAEGEEALSALLEASMSPRSRIRHGAALALGGRFVAAATEALLKLADDENAGVRAAAIQSLGLSADPQVIPVLLRLAGEDPSQSVRTEAIRSLRSRDFADHPLVQKAFAGMAAADFDAGVPDPKHPSIAHQGAHTFVLRDWTQAYEEDRVTNLTYETTMCYDSHRNRIIAWGAHGRRYDSPQTGLTWFFDVVQRTWKRLHRSRQWPNGTCCNRQIVFDPNQKLAIIPKSGGGGATSGHGWLNGLRGNLSFSIPWVLDVVDDEWYPMRPSEDFGSLGMVGGSYDPRHGVSVWWNGELVAYDAGANRWLRLNPSGPAPEFSVNNSAVFDPKTGKLIVIGSNSTWAWDPVTNRWQDLLPSGDAAPTEAPMVYDSVNDVMLALKEAGQQPMEVWVYHLRENHWEKLPGVNPAPRYGTMFDAAYDPENNLVVISGNESMSWSGALTARETWTYRYKPAEISRGPGSPHSARNVRVVTESEGSAKITWSAPASGNVSGYRVMRKIAENPYEGTWEPVGRTSSDQLAFSDSAVPGRKTIYYAVTAESDPLNAGPPSVPARTAAPAPRWVSGVVTVEGVRLRWQPSPAEDVTGYHVYRADADVRWPWHDRFDPQQQTGEFAAITDRPVSTTEFIDTGAKVQGPGSELHWPKTFAYVVRPVNRWGVEGGASPVTLALADPPGPVHEIPWLDGRRLILWSPSRCNKDLRGYHVIRMDDWHRDYAFRWQAAPVAGTAFFDDEEYPRADRRRYYVVGVDATGTIGIPSNGAWSHGLP